MIAAMATNGNVALFTFNQKQFRCFDALSLLPYVCLPADVPLSPPLYHAGMLNIRGRYHAVIRKVNFK